MTVSSVASDHDHRGVIVATLLCVFSMAPFLVLPLLISAVIREFGATEREVGLFSMAVMFGGPLGSLLTMLLVRRINWPRFAQVLLALFCLGFFSVMWIESLFILALTLGGISMAGSAAYSLGLSALSDTANPRRAFGICIASQVALQVAGMLAMPLYADKNIDYLFLSFLLPCAVLISLMHWLPERKPIDESRTVAFFPRFDSATIFALTGCFLFFFNVGIVWTYVEPLGTYLKLKVDALSLILAVGVGIGIFGALATNEFLARYSHASALVLVAVGSAVAIGLMLAPWGLLPFAVGVGLYNLAWNFGLSQQYASVAEIDGSGRALALVPAVQGVGGAMGPGLIGLASTGSANYTAILAPAIVAVVGSSLLLWRAQRPKTEAANF